MAGRVLDGGTRRLKLALGGQLVALVCLAVAAAPAHAQAPEDKALGRPAAASSVEDTTNSFGCGGGRCTPEKGNDGAADTRWGSGFANNQHWTVDLGRPRLIDSVSIEWENAYASRYRIGVSLEAGGFKTVAEVDFKPSLAARLQAEATKRFKPEVSSFGVQSARYVRITGLTRSNPAWGISFWTASVFGPPDVVAPVPPPPAPTPAPAPVVSPFNSPGPSTPPSPSPAPAPQPTAPPGTKTPLKLLAPFPIVRIVGTATASGASIKRFTVRAPRSARVRVTCKGGGCPKRTLRRRGTGRVPGIQRRLRVGAVVRVFVTQKGRVGKYTRFVIRKGQAPGRVDSCAIYGARRPTRCPAR